MNEQRRLRIGKRADNLTPEQRSRAMSRVKSRNNSLEMRLYDELRKRRLSFETHAKDLPGSPDAVFRKSRLAVFVHGDFWHGFRFPIWASTVSPFWQKKISTNRKRDRRTVNALRRAGWRVIVIWQHQLLKDRDRAVLRIAQALKSGGGK